MTRTAVDLGGDDWRFGCVSPKPLDSRLDDRAEVDEWLPAHVPGNVRSDLLALGRIKDPFYGANNEDSQWVDNFDWWYARPLSVDLEEGERAFLSFEGVDYISAVYLDHLELGRHEGMFSQQVYEITGLIRPDGSQVAVRIWGSNSLPRRQLSWWEKLWSCLVTAIPRTPEAFPDRTATLKCQMGFGWDFAPRMRTMGLWDEASLIIARSVFVSDIFIAARIDHSEAQITVQATLDSDRAQSIAAEIEVTESGPQRSRNWRWKFDLALEAGRQTRELEFTLPEPRLWHPWDRGAPDMYHLRLRILRAGQVLDSLCDSFGLRTVKMAPNPQTPPGNGDWTLVVNGAREFVRGANWVPIDALPGRVRPEDYATLVNMAKKAGINLLRIWGGGLREKRAFYDLCDTKGIMVWQEFPLSYLPLGHFPRQATFLGLVTREATSIVRQLRNHPSLIVWCGGNEFSYRRNRRLVDRLEAIVLKEDGTRPFRKTSPGQGDKHNWLVWHGKAPILDYRKDPSPFVSEFGLQSIPQVSSLSRFLPDKDLYPPREGWQYHCAQLEKLERYVRPFCPNSLQECVETSQKVQAYGLQVAIEHFRRRKYRTSGTIIWQLNDPWPAISWSLIDYYRQPKLAYVKLEALYSPVLISLEYPLREYRAGDLFGARVWVINDLLTPCEDCLLEIHVNGENIFSRTVSLPPDSSQVVGQVEHRIGEQKGKLTAALWQDGQPISSNEYDLRYHDPRETRLLDILYSKLGEWVME
ncbi:MAG: hypothetical protein CEE40_05760 [Chloroflexi bacterium B3_Chlor]|nr:MAG: hypothetical protein CEE40_05760 [Chloroflexi bacterium B3_Chlor]